MSSDMTPDMATDAAGVPVGPHPARIEVARAYVNQKMIVEDLAKLGYTEEKEIHTRLQGINWIENVRQACNFPIRTFDTAAAFYLRFRLRHHEDKYDYRDVAGASLFAASKVEDTLKKSRDIICASYNCKVPPSEQLSSDESLFDEPSKTMVNLERAVLEASGFDLRSRAPQKLMTWLVKGSGGDKEESFVAWEVCTDLYRTYAPLKQTKACLAISAFEMAVRLTDASLEKLNFKHFSMFKLTRAEITETLFDLLDLYTQHQKSTLIGPKYELKKFIGVRITLNQEMAANNLPRYAFCGDWVPDAPNAPVVKTEASSAAGATNGDSKSNVASPSTDATMTGNSSTEPRKHQTVRFLMDPAEAEHEKKIVAEYFRPEESDEEGGKEAKVKKEKVKKERFSDDEDTE